MLSCDGLSLSIEGRTLFTNLSFQIKEGGAVCVVGCNGSGKSSLLRMIAGIDPSCDAKIKLKGRPIGECKKPYAVYLGHQSGFKLQMTVRENLEFWSRIFNAQASATNVIDAVVYYMGLGDIIDTHCSKLSAGNLKKATIARLMLCKSDLWLLDEVHTNLDQSNLELLQNIVSAKLGSGGIVVLTSCNTEEMFAKQIPNICLSKFQ